MRARYTLFQRCLIGQPTHHSSSLTTGIRHKSTLKDILRPESFASIVQKDFEQFHEAKVAFDAKLRTYFQQAKELSQNHHYDAAGELEI